MIVMKITDTKLDVKGGVKVPGYEQTIELEHVSWSASKAVRHAEEKSEAGRPDLGGVSMTLAVGPWIPVLQAALYNGQNLTKVEITELKQEGGAGGDMKKRRVITLEGAHVESLQHSWQDIQATAQMTLNFSKIVYDWGGAISGFNRDQTNQ